VQEFEFCLEENLFRMHGDLARGQYRFAPYQPFSIADPKPRHIHKACVRDRVFHQAVFRALSPIFERISLFDSYSCRVGKGTHRAVTRLDSFLRKASGNGAHLAWALKCDVQKFFDSVDHNILLELVARRVSDARTLALVRRIVAGFEAAPGKGIPLGNVTSQLFANIYMHELDRFVKHSLRAKRYVRYCDDFVMVDANREILSNYIPLIRRFLSSELKLTLHPEKIIFRKYSQGVDFLGYVLFPHHRVLRPRTARRMLAALLHAPNPCAIPSYLGMLSRCSGFCLAEQVCAIEKKWYDDK
jgi:RNA-directed DNA polymerase